MSNELMKLEEIDGFDSFESGYEDDAEGALSGSIIRGTTRLKFINDYTWVEAVSQAPVPPDLELLLVDVARVVIRFKGNVPEQRVLAPGEKFPNLKALNDTVPREEWKTDFNGNLVGPWQAQHVLFFVNEQTLDKYSWPAPTVTIGSTLCVEDIVGKIKWMRKYRGEHVHPVILLKNTFMKTRFGGAAGGRQRPHLSVKRWIRLGGDSGLALPAQLEPKQITSSQQAAPNAVQTVSEPSLGEEMGEEIPF